MQHGLICIYAFILIFHSDSLTSKEMQVHTIVFPLVKALTCPQKEGTQLTPKINEACAIRLKKLLCSTIGD